MTKDVEFLQKEIAGLRAEKEKHIAQANVIEGAIQAYLIMLQRANEEPSVTNGHDKGVPIEELSGKAKSKKSTEKSAKAA